MSGDKKFYVYIHRRKTDGKVFYVGKGQGRRKYSYNDRSDWWKRVVEKHGYTIEIAQDKMMEPESFLLEMWLIAKFRHEGQPLVNLTDGGDGSSGYKHTKENILKMRNSHNGDMVYCSNGMSFVSQNEAARWLRKNGFPKANAAGVNSCIKKTNNTISYLGYAWSHEPYPDNPELSKEDVWSRNGKKSSKPVYCVDTGEEFDSINDAVRWLMSIGINKIGGEQISRACRRNNGKACGYRWRWN